MSTRPHATALGRLGEAVAKRQDALRAEAGAKQEARRALFARPTVPGLRPLRRPVLMGAAAMVIALTAVLLVVPWSDSSSLVGRHSAASQAQVLRFDDGSQVTVKPGAAVRVAGADERGAEVVLEQGSLFASIVKRPEARWTFGAGDYLVSVTGTAFDLSWAPPELTIVMHEGKVVVTGPELGAGREVAAGERVVFGPSEQEAASAEGVSHGAPVAAPPAPSVEAATPSAAAAEGWQARAARGDHEGAYQAVAPRLDSELVSLDAASLLRLATVARLSGHPEVARRIYGALRERFPSTPSAAEAAFALGTMAFATHGAEAERWLRVALAEAPGGGLAESARGRLLELAIRRGDAKEAARDYLWHHPDGPHAALAREALAP